MSISNARLSPNPEISALSLPLERAETLERQYGGSFQMLQLVA